MSKEFPDLILPRKPEDEKPIKNSGERQAGDEESFPEFLDFPWKNNKPTEEEMQKFFTPETISQRILFCPQINIDTIDYWGISGYEEGFIFIKGLANKGIHCLGDQLWANGKSLKPSDSVPILSHYDFFPRKKFSHILITQNNCPVIYNFLKKKLGNIKFLGELKNEEQK